MGNACLHLRQPKYISDLLESTKMVGAKPLASPIILGTKLSSGQGLLLNDLTENRHVVGAFQYYTISRHISYDVNQLCQFMHSPREPHWLSNGFSNNLKEPLILVSNTLIQALFLIYFVTRNLDDKKNTSGYGIFIGLSQEAECCVPFKYRC